MFNSNNITPPGLRDWRGSAGAVGDHAVWLINSDDDFPAGVQDGDFGLWLLGWKPMVFRYKENIPIIAGAGGGSVSLWIAPNVYEGSPEVIAYLVGNETTGQLFTQGLAPLTAVTGTITSTGSRIRLQSDGNLPGSQAALACVEPILFSERFYFRGNVQGQYGVGAGIEAGFFHPPVNSTNTQYTLAKIATSSVLANYVWGTGAWAPTTTPVVLNQSGLGLPAQAQFFEVNSNDGLRPLVTSSFDGVPYTCIRRGVAANIPTDPFSLEIRVTGGATGTPTRIELQRFYVMRF